MFTHEYIQPYQVNSFVFCKRKWYYQNRLKFYIENEDMKIGRYEHEHFQLSKSILNNLKHKELYLISHRWKLKGRSDYLIEDVGKFIPLEVKSGRSNQGNPFFNDVMQLMCYVLLLEDHFGSKIEEGQIMYLRNPPPISVKKTVRRISLLKKYLKQMHLYSRRKILPKNQKENKCWRCSYHDFCWY